MLQASMNMRDTSTKRPTAALREVEAHQTRLWLLEQERAADGAMFFDADSMATYTICRRLINKRRNDFSLSNANREAVMKLLKHILIHADASAWPAPDKPERLVASYPEVFSKTDIADIAIAREALKKPHEYAAYIGRQISEQGDLGVFTHLFSKGGTYWQEFALTHLSKAVGCYAYNGLPENIPENWPGLVLQRLNGIQSVNSGVMARIRGIKEQIEAIKEDAKTRAVREALRPFQA